MIAIEQLRELFLRDGLRLGLLQREVPQKVPLDALDLRLGVLRTCRLISDEPPGIDAPQAAPDLSARRLPAASAVRAAAQPPAWRARRSTGIREGFAEWGESSPLLLLRRAGLAGCDDVDRAVVRTQILVGGLLDQ